MYYINKETLGTTDHVYPTDETAQESGYYLVADGTSQPGTVQSFARILGKEIKLLPPEIEKSLHRCNIPSRQAGLCHLVEPHRLAEIIECFHEKVTSQLAPIAEYAPFYAENVTTLNSCAPMLLRAGTTGTGVDSGGLCERILYDTASTKTGRMSVVSGPNALTMQKEFKRNLISCFEGGSIIEVDYSALEPRSALAIANSEIASVEDVYNDIGNRLGINDRAVAKQVIISFLYGAAKATISRIAGIPEYILQPKLDELKDIFLYDETIAEINQQLAKNGYFRNHAGRIIFPTSEKSGTLFNNYCQSTAVDIAMSGFTSMLSLFRENNLSARPICFIHDAVVLDVPKKELEFVKNNVKQLPTYLGIDFPTKLNVLNDE